MDVAIWALGVLALAVAFGGLSQGLMGFGLSLVSVPLMVLVVEPTVAVPVALVHGTVVNSALAYQLRANVDLGRMWPMVVAGVAGIPLGTYMLIWLDVELLKVFVGSVIVAFALAFILELGRPVRAERAAMVPVGFASGFLNGVMTTSGPPAILFLSNQRVDKARFRANLVAFFLILNVATFPLFLYEGILTAGVMGLSLALVPALAAGVVAGALLVDRVNERAFRRLTLALVTVTGAMLVLAGIGVI